MYVSFAHYGTLVLSSRCTTTTRLRAGVGYDDNDDRSTRTGHGTLTMLGHARLSARDARSPLGAIRGTDRRTIANATTLSALLSTHSVCVRSLSFSCSFFPTLYSLYSLGVRSRSHSAHPRHGHRRSARSDRL